MVLFVHSIKNQEAPETVLVAVKEVFANKDDSDDLNSLMRTREHISALQLRSWRILEVSIEANPKMRIQARAASLDSHKVNMSMHHGASEENSPLRNLSLSDPRCANDSCLAFYAAHNASQAAVSYAFQFEYGYFVTYYYAMLIAIFVALNGLYLWHDRRARQKSTTEPGLMTRGYTKAVALTRLVSYCRLRSRVLNSAGYLPSVGMLLFLGLGVLFFTILTFAIRPYYRERRGFGSPPIGVRTGLMATALTPIIVALSGKASVITVLTGIGHEKLNVIHRWTAWACLALSVVHTVPFLVAPYKDGGAAQLRKQFYKKNGYEFTGTPPLAILIGIVAFSVPWIRHRFYETFYHLHILMGIIYVALMFWHCNDQRDSWAYMWATIALWLASIAARVFWYNRAFNIKAQWFEGSSTSLQALAGGMSRLTVSIPQNFHWRAGQHCFLRFPSVSLLDNHPFTIAGYAADETDSINEATSPTKKRKAIIFLVRSRTGFTRKLSNFVNKSSSQRAACWLDGPYGGLNRKVENAFNSVILIAGGTGITSILPWLQHLSTHMRAGASRTTNVQLIWVVRQSEHFQWVADELAEAMRLSAEGTVSMEFYVTGDVDSNTSSLKEEKDEDKDVEDSEIKTSEKTSRSIHALGTCQTGRPDLRTQVSHLKMGGRTIVFCCGPESMKIDISNACAAAQKRVLSGEVDELALHTDTFGW